MKRITALFLAAVMIVLSAASLTACGNKTSDFKVGVILVGDATEGYTKAHIDGIQAAAKKLGLADSQIEWKYSVPETSDCANAAEDLVDKGCKIVISNSYGHQNYMAEVAPKYPDVTFVAMTGDLPLSAVSQTFATLSQRFMNPVTYQALLQVSSSKSFLTRAPFLRTLPPMHMMLTATSRSAT